MDGSLSQAPYAGASTNPLVHPYSVAAAQERRHDAIPSPAVDAPAGPEAGLGSHCEIRGQIPANNRAMRYSLQRSACKVLAWQTTPKGRPYRVLNCHRAAGHGSTGVQLLQGPAGAKFGGLQTCGSVWTCAVCSEKVTRRREGEIQMALAAHLRGGGFSLMVTLTHSHARGDSLAGMVAAYGAAVRSMTSWRAYKDLVKSLGYVGKIRALEVTYGDESGWHPHGHELWFIRQQLDADELEALRVAVYGLWRRACLKHGLPAPSEKHGVAISHATSAAEYMAKANRDTKRKPGEGWTAGKEMTRAHSKKAKGPRFTPFDLLRAMADGYQPPRMVELFREYAHAYHGRRQLHWSAGLKAMFGIEEVDDDAAAEEVEAEHSVAGRIALVDWRTRVLTQPTDRRAELLEAFERGGMPAVDALVRSMPIRCRSASEFGLDPPHLRDQPA